MPNKEILSDQVQGWYNTFNKVNSLYGPGTISNLTMEGTNIEDSADDVDINNLVNKIDQMQTDPYFASEPTLYTSYSTVSDGQIIQYGDVYERMTTVMNNINKIVCRNMATNSYGSNEHGTNTHGTNTHGTNSNVAKSHTACTSNGSNGHGTNAPDGTWGYGGHVSQGCTGNVVHYTHSANSRTCSNGYKNNGNKSHGTHTNCNYNGNSNSGCNHASYSHGACTQGGNTHGTCVAHTADYDILCANTTNSNTVRK